MLHATPYQMMTPPRPSAMVGFGNEEEGPTIGKAILGGALEGVFIYAVCRWAAKIESAKARKTALWMGGIYTGINLLKTFKVW